MKYSFRYYRITIYDCYKYNREEQIQLLEEAKANNPNNAVWNRSMYSILSEWRVHKLCYKLGIYKDKCKDADIEYPIDGKLEIVYKIIGFFL